jgi:hypothetical protein
MTASNKGSKGDEGGTELFPLLVLLLLALVGVREGGGDLKTAGP